MLGWPRERYERLLLTFARAVTVGAAYVSTFPIPGLTSAFVAIFTSLLSFDSLVASPTIPFRLRDWKQIVAVLHPRIVSMAISVLKGVAVAAVMGILTVLGLPFVVGAVFTSGLAYVWTSGTRHLITIWVAILPAVALFERLAALERVHTVRIAMEIAAVIVDAGAGMFMALLAGWTAGIVTGTVTRLFLSRPYRSLSSAAYELPLKMRPFNEVLHVGERSLVVTVSVEEGAPAAHRSLVELGLRDRWGTTVLSIKRADGEEVSLPDGSCLVLPGDSILMLVDRERSEGLYDLFRAAPAAGAAMREGA